MPKLIFKPEDSFDTKTLAIQLQEGIGSKYEVQYPGKDWKAFDIIVKENSMNSVSVYASKKKDGRTIVRYNFQSVGLLWRFMPLLIVLLLPIGAMVFIYWLVMRDKKIYQEVDQLIRAQYPDNFA